MFLLLYSLSSFWLLLSLAMLEGLDVFCSERLQVGERWLQARRPKVGVQGLLSIIVQYVMIYSDSISYSILQSNTVW